MTRLPPRAKKGDPLVVPAFIRVDGTTHPLAYDPVPLSVALRAAGDVLAGKLWPGGPQAAIRVCLTWVEDGRTLTLHGPGRLPKMGEHL